jgi:F-type H+-transporting ATPase subunit alpha
MDAVTRATLDKGRKNAELLIQPQYKPVPVEKEIAIIYAGTHGLLANVPVNKVRDFEATFLEMLEMKHKEDVLNVLRQGILNEEVETKLKEVAIEVAKNYEWHH